MKKLLIIAAAALLAAACAKTYEVKETTPPAIGFGTWTETLTKAPHLAGVTSFVSGDKFFVYGVKTTTASSSNVDVFTGDEVGYNGTWSYSPIRFWDSNTDSYTFNAVSPSEGVTAATLINSCAPVAASNNIVSNDVTFTGSTNDILVSDKVVVENAHYGEVVNLNFRHIAALFDLQVRLGTGFDVTGATVKISKVELQNIESSGHFTVTGYSTSDGKASVTWENKDTTNPVTDTYDSSEDYEPSETPATPVISSSNKFTVTANYTAGSTQDLIKNLIVMPQSFVAGKQKLVIDYEITTGTGTAEQTVSFTNKGCDLIAFDISDYPTDDNTSEAGNQYNGATAVSGWVYGYHYTYIITIDANAIQFTGAITDWTTDTQNGYHTLLL